VPLVQLCQQRRQAQRGRGLHAADAQRPGRRLAALQQGQCLVVCLQHLLGIAAQQAPGGCGVHRGTAFQQLGAGLVFQLLDVRRHIGLHGVQQLGGRTEAAGFAHGFEHAQGFELHGDPI